MRFFVNNYQHRQPDKISKQNNKKKNTDTKRIYYFRMNIQINTSIKTIGNYADDDRVRPMFHLPVYIGSSVGAPGTGGFVLTDVQACTDRTDEEKRGNSASYIYH